MMDLYDLAFAKNISGGGTPAPEPTLITKNITANGTYNAADDSADGYSSVSVNVAPPLTPYLMSHGEEYILIDNTDIDITNNPVLQMDYYIDADNSMSDEWHGLFGCGYANVDQQFSVMYNPSIGTNGSLTWQRAYYYSTIDSLYGKCQVNFGNSTAYVSNSNGANCAGSAVYTNGNVYRTKFAIFGRYKGSDDSIESTGTIIGIARIRIWTAGGNAIADMIPAIDPSTNKACLYDRITQKYYGNSNPESSTDFEIIEM